MPCCVCTTGSPMFSSDKSLMRASTSLTCSCFLRRLAVGAAANSSVSGQWEKAKRRAAEQVRDSAAELLNIYARRAARQGHAFRYSAADYEVFANDFGFDETVDQKAAIHALIQAMISPEAMDRTVLGY